MSTTLSAEQTTGRRTVLRVDDVGAGRACLRSETVGERTLPGLRPMLVESGPGRATVCLVPDGALLLAGDAVRIDIEVGPGTRLHLVEPTGTVAYDMRGGSAVWDVRIALAEGASLVWAGEPFVVAAGARVRRRTRVVLGTGARLAMRELLVLGRHGERGGRLEQQWSARDEHGNDLLVEELVLDDGAHRPGVLGSNRVLGSVVALGFEPGFGTCPGERLDLEEGGTLWRRIGADAHLAVPDEVWRATLDGL